MYFVYIVGLLIYHLRFTDVTWDVCIMTLIKNYLISSRLYTNVLMSYSGQMEVAVVAIL